jgi:predicted  nucleic acid-binding Zn-ribbon protein
MEERNTSDPSGHRRRLLELDKDALADEVIRTWDTLADSEAELSELRMTVGKLEVEIAKMRGKRGISSTKIEMANRIEELEREISILSVKEGQEDGDEELLRLREREEFLLASLLDLEREFAASQSM